MTLFVRDLNWTAESRKVDAEYTVNGRWLVWGLAPDGIHKLLGAGDTLEDALGAFIARFEEEQQK